ncbi:hypothetical protein GGR55DRAFT_382837 [Xylaria sp. FL0064]|nr:hypothetical protein GGR55DRAFT_382837 [Xylaria sp. FL0064]
MHSKLWVFVDIFQVHNRTLIPLFGLIYLCSLPLWLLFHYTASIHVHNFTLPGVPYTALINPLTIEPLHEEETEKEKTRKKKESSGLDSSILNLHQLERSMRLEDAATYLRLCHSILIRLTHLPSQEQERD